MKYYLQFKNSAGSIFSYLIFVSGIFILTYSWITLFKIGNKHLPEHVIVQTDSKQTDKNTMEQALDFSEIAEENLRRQSRVSDYCMKEEIKRHMPTVTKVRSLTDPKHSIIYCRVNKASSTFTIKLLERLFNCSVECMRNAATKLYNLPPKEISETTDAAYKFMFVREPYGRLFSTYCNKFYFPKGNWTPVGQDIVRRYRKNPSADSVKYGHNITFAELILYIIEEFDGGKGDDLDEHIRPMHVRCYPCDYKYNFIGKMETILSDWGYLLHEWESRHILHRVPSHVGKKNKSETFFPMNKVLLTLEIVKDSNISIHNIYERAWHYFQITGEISKHIQMPFIIFNNNYSNTMSHVAFLQALETAADLSSVNATEVKRQRHEAMVQAYSTVPLTHLERLREVVLKDCLLYGYEDRPEWLFGRTEIGDRNSFHYFGALS